MFSVFKRRQPAYPAEGSWSVLEGEHEGKPMFVRRNDSGKRLLGHVDYKFRIGVAIPLLEPRPDGLPTKDEMDVLLRIEDAVSEKLERGQVSLQVLSITTSGMRELIFYTRSPSIVPTALQEIQAQFQSHRVQHYVEEDPNWAVYRQFA